MADNPFAEILSMMQQNQRTSNPWADASSIFGAFSSGRKADRVAQGTMQGQQDQNNQSLISNFNRDMIAAQTGRNQNEQDAWQKLGQSSYILGGGSKFTPPTINLRGRAISTPDFGFGPQAPSEAMKTAAAGMQPMLMDRLKSGGSYVPERPPMSDLSSSMNPGRLENLTSGLATGAGIIGAIPGAGSRISSMLGLGGGAGAVNGVRQLTMDQAMQAASGAAPAVTSGVSGILGKALPIAGAVTGGVGLLKDRGTLGNLANGATTGASIGSMIAPGIGTALGAGIGALGGLIRGIGGGPSKEEKEARAAQRGVIQQIIQGATPQQQAEAQAAGWDKPEEALARIMLRDRLGSDQQADEAMKRLYAASKQNAGAVAAASNGLTGGSVGGPPTLQRPQGW